MLTSEVLQAARNEILRCGWHQGSYYNHETGEKCVAGAILSVVDDDTRDMVNPACVALGEVLGVEHIAQWNDAPGRTPEDVLAAFDAAIAIAQWNEHKHRVERPS